MSDAPCRLGSSCRQAEKLLRRGKWESRLLADHGSFFSCSLSHMGPGLRIYARLEPDRQESLKDFILWRLISSSSSPSTLRTGYEEMVLPCRKAGGGET